MADKTANAWVEQMVFGMAEKLVEILDIEQADLKVYLMVELWVELKAV